MYVNYIVLRNPKTNHVCWTVYDENRTYYGETELITTDKNAALNKVTELIRKD